MGEWLPDQLGTYLNFKNGKTSPDRSDIAPVPVYGSNGLIGHAHKTNANTNTIIIGRVGTYCGSLHFSKKECWVTDNAIICTAPEAEDRFWLYALSSLDLNNYRAGSGQPLLNQTILKSINFLTPPEEDRITIGKTLSALDDKIELNRRMNETLEGMARAIFKDWFVDFGPTRAKQQGQPPYLPPKIWSLFPDKLDEEGKPEGWNMGTLEDIAETNARSWTAKNHPDAVEYVDLSNTKWGIIESTASLKWDKAPSRARRIVKNGDTIVGTTRPGNGSFAYISNDGYTASTGFAVLSPRKAIYRDLVYITATNSENIKRLANLADGHGGAYPAVKPDVVSETKLVLAGDEIITAFADITSELQKKIEQSKAETCTLAKTRDLLLPKLMSGEIRVRDAKKQIEGAL